MIAVLGVPEDSVGKRSPESCSQSVEQGSMRRAESGNI